MVFRALIGSKSLQLGQGFVKPFPFSKWWDLLATSSGELERFCGVETETL
jgi:hypothetical protein